MREAQHETHRINLPHAAVVDGGPHAMPAASRIMGTVTAATAAPVAFGCAAKKSIPSRILSDGRAGLMSYLSGHNERKKRQD